MNVNGSRHQLLLGLQDWGRCLDSEELDALTLAQWWSGVPVSPALATSIPEWDSQRHELHIRTAAIVLPPTTGEAPLALTARRSAASDRFGNVYRIGADQLTLRVRSAGSQRESQFWPVADDCDAAHFSAHSDFQPLAVAVAPAPTSMRALTVTGDHYLVVAFARGGERGFLTFDLAAGGSPVETLWPMTTLDAFDMAPRCGGGVWMLERSETQARLWELDRKLAVVSRAQAEQTLEAAALDDFQPLTGPPRQQTARTLPAGIDLLAAPVAAIDPIAIEVLGCDRVLVLDLDAAAQRSRVLRIHRDGDVLQVAATPWIDETAHDFVVADDCERPDDAASGRCLFLTTVHGNQAFAYVIEPDDAAFRLRRQTELFPLRLYGGRALLAVNGRAYYDSGINDVRWAPIVRQPRARFQDHAELLTPVFDARELGTTWDRVMLDARIPADTRVEIDSRAADELIVADAPVSPADQGSQQVLAPWHREPHPYLRSEGAELPWLREEAARATQRSTGTGTWEVLLQNARGRYLQLRIRLVSGNGTATPRLRALRAWTPRFSWSRRFLPAVYREGPANASLIERWLANFEGTLTGIEERMVQAQALFDPRTAPSGTLEWLVQWFDVAFDPAWDESRRRLFVRRAMDFFRWRGTSHGLRLALELAFDGCIDPRLFDGPDGDAAPPQSIRIVEAFTTRLFGGAIAGDPAQSTEAGPREVIRGVLWSPQEGNAGLADRYARARGQTGGATPLEQLTPFSLVAPAAQDQAARWREFAMASLGFVPAIGAQERTQWSNYRRSRSDAAAPTTEFELPGDWPTAESERSLWQSFGELRSQQWLAQRWSDFLARRYRRIEQLNRAWGTHWPAFDLVALPAVLPATIAAQTDWLQFERELLAMHRTAHRFSVLLPVKSVNEDPVALDTRLRLAQRIVDLEKPAHTVFDVRLYWALNRIGEARLGIDTLLGQGSRAPELVPYAQLGRAYIGASFVAGERQPVERDRALLEC